MSVFDYRKPNDEVVKKSIISPLRQRMIDDMNLAGLMPATQDSYISAVKRIQRVTGVRPDKLVEEDVRKYLIHIRDVEEMAKGTFQTNYSGLKFFYYRTLDRDWSLFSKKRFVFRSRSASLTPFPEATAAA